MNSVGSSSYIIVSESTITPLSETTQLWLGFGFLGVVALIGIGCLALYLKTKDVY